MLRRHLAAVTVSLALVSGLSASPAHAAGPSPNGQNHPNHPVPCASGHQKCDIPEAPWPIGLPIAGLGVLGGYVVLMRRRDPDGRSPKIAGTR
jgi:hypothetical protein